MKIRHYVLLAAMTLSLGASAGNTITKVAQVTDAVTLTTDVDYVVTDATPFTTTGSINIENTEHAVIIFQKIKPSKVKSMGLLKNIYINGEPAVAGDLTSANATAGSNCQVKMYNRGSIIMPYGQKFRPLTCYTEADFGGESSNEYTEGSNGGFMKNLNAATLNNNFKSFKLKRGYMVTFALGTGGWGYSRCFIADSEDLEMNLPVNMAGRVSSYRLFKWWDASKAGVHDTSAAANNALNTTSAFDWAQGNASLLPDVEWVPNHIYEDWPSAATCGNVTGSCHMKTNNEPGNSADDHPQDVETVLNNWQNLMRTGMRLCSESSHDGSMNHLKTFIQEIDARGWRCDILDLHCYWTAGSFNNLTWYSDNYGNGRPIWISEWVWGASWNHNGFWGAVSDPGSVSAANQKVLYDNTKPILEKLNANDRVERYFYWNSEAAGTHIYHDGKPTQLGEYYAKMETGLAYNKKNEYVPKVVYSTPSDVVIDYKKAKGIATITWNDSNGDMLDSLVVEYKAPGSSKYVWLASMPLKDQNSKNGATYSYEATVQPGANYYRIAAYPMGSKTALYSDDVSCTASSAKGTDLYQFGKISVTNTNAITTDFSEPFKAIPGIFMGVISNKNPKLYPGNLITTAQKGKFSYQVLPGKQQGSTSITEVEKEEEIPFLALQDSTNFKFGDLDCEVCDVKVNMKDTLQVTFQKPFPEGVTPIVIGELRNITLKSDPICVRIWDVTNTGFKTIARYETGVGKTATTKLNMCYLAITPGLGVLDAENEIIIAAGHGDNIYTSSARSLSFTNGEETLYFKDPLIFGALQTLRYDIGSVLRRQSDVTETDKESATYGLTTGTRIKRQVDASAANYSTTNVSDKTKADEFGWVIIANYDAQGSTPTSIEKVVRSLNTNSQFNVNVEDGRISMAGNQPFEVYNASGSKVSPNAKLAPGIYVVKSGKNSAKVLVK